MQELGIQPDRTFKEESISPHMHYLKNKLKGKLGILDRYKKDPHLERIMRVSIKSELGMEFSFYEEELAFINATGDESAYSGDLQGK